MTNAVNSDTSALEVKRVYSVFLGDGPYGDGVRRIQLSLTAHASNQRAAACVERGI